uniref:ribosomal protein L24 n=1 Tax=Rhodospora sordida TaxID=362230 RepID=UPI001FCDCA99|nr:ribosomal protein L24 [Rhodospora sordida]UNJ14968.1 ribosomal protein L24 [Rhodospora sordida]
MKKPKNKKKNMHVKVGDTIKIITGKDKGKIGKVLQTFSKKSFVIIDGINIKTKHQKSRQEGEKGSIVKKEAPIHSSNLMLYSEKDEIISRVGHKKDRSGSKIRYLMKNKEIIN